MDVSAERIKAKKPSVTLMVTVNVNRLLSAYQLFRTHGVANRIEGLTLE